MENVKEVINRCMQCRDGYRRENVLVFVMKRIQMEISMEKPIDFILRQNVMEKKKGQIERNRADGST